MRAVGIKVLKNKLSEYVRIAAGGETVLITDRERVVAEMGPPSETRGPNAADSLLADAIRRGLITPAANPGTDPPPRLPMTTFDKLMADLERDREDR